MIDRTNTEEIGMSKVVRIEQNGGPEQMKLVDLPVGNPGPGEI